MKIKLSNSTIELLVITFIAIIGTFIYAYVSYVIITDTFPDSAISIWKAWDTQHYLNIAKEGYSNSTLNEKHLLIAFFPLYPIVIKIFSLLFQNYLLSALLVSNIAYIFAVFYLYKLVRLDFEKDDALRSIIYFSIFPTAYFLHAAYTESLFLALTIASFYYARKQRWAVSGTLGMLSAMTRVTGIIILPILLIEYLYLKEFKKENVKKDILWILVIGLGLLAYLVINYMTYGDPFKFLEIQKGHWGMHLSLPTEGFFNALSSTNWRDPADTMSLGWLQLVFAILGLVLTIYCFFRLRLSYSLYALANWLVLTSTSFWISIPRFMLTLFPIFIVLALLGKRKEINYSIIFLSILFYAFFLLRLVRSQWAF